MSFAGNCGGRTCRRNQGHVAPRRRHGVSVGRGNHARRQGQARTGRAHAAVRRSSGKCRLLLHPRRRQGHRQAGDRLGRHPQRVRAACGRCGRDHGKAARRGCDREAQGRQGGAAGIRRCRRDAEAADRQPDAASHQACARERCGCAAARLGPAFRPDRRARRRGAEDHPRYAGEDARRRSADQGSRRQAGVAGADAAGAHRGQGVRECRRLPWRPISSSATR